MKRVIYFVLFITSIFFVGCSDMNVLTPEVSNPNQEWSLEHFVDFLQATTTNPLGARLTLTHDKVRGEIVAKNIITTDAKTEMFPTSSVIERGKSIEIIYKDQSPAGTLPANFSKNYEMTHRFTIVKQGMGTGGKIKVIVRYLYPDINLGASRYEEYMLTPQ